MRTSVCITVLNEQESIGRLLDALLAQTQKPSEIIIVDGGSTDQTGEIVRHYQKKNRAIKFLVEPGTIAHGRNVGIELARSPLIALTDASCLPQPDWLEKLAHPFKFAKVGMVAGFYQMPAKTPLNQALNVFLGVPPQRFDPTRFLPSARSVAFRKELWEEIGGFNEKFDRGGEDTEFFYQAVKTGTRIVRVEEAIVIWKEVENLSFQEALKKFYVYAKGDGQAKIWWHPTKQLTSHNIKISMIFLRYLLGLTLLWLSFWRTSLLALVGILLLAYLVWAIVKWNDVIKNYQARLWLPVVQITADLAVMAGFLVGLFKR